VNGSILIRRTTLPILLQDRGRSGYADIGVPTSGAFDSTAAELAQRLVGNPPTAAALEITMGGVDLECDVTTTVVVCGAAAEIRVGNRAAAINEVVSWPAGTTLRIAAVHAGVRNYVAVRGGFAVPMVLGSASTDLLSGLGPAPMRAGERLRLAHADADLPRIGHVPQRRYPQTVLRVHLGPRHEWFTTDALAALRTATFTISAESNRIGLRLHGPELQRSRSSELPSEPLQRGALQVPPNGAPIIMGPDHPTTGGYPVIATVLSRDWDALGQLRPGDALRFKVLQHAGAKSRRDPDVC
jgi:biotin-dependent carboxylase-like uncharacterized protein